MADTKDDINATTSENITLSKEQYNKLMGRIDSLEKQTKKAIKADTITAVLPPAAFDPVAENEKRMQELVEVRLFKDNGKYKDDVFVSVNGKAYQIKRGETVKVPRFVKEVLDSSISQDQYAAQYAEELADTYEKSNKQ